MLADGVQVYPMAYVGVRVQVGYGCIISTGAIVSHDCKLAPYVNLSPGATLAGCCGRRSSPGWHARHDQPECEHRQTGGLGTGQRSNRTSRMAELSQPEPSAAQALDLCRDGR